MKKLIPLLVVCVLCLCLSACGGNANTTTTEQTTTQQAAQSEQAKKCDELILAIGEVTLDSLNAIETAETHYEALTESQKNEVENNVILVQARKDYDKLLAEEENKLSKSEEIILGYAQTIKDSLADSDSFELKSAEYCSSPNIAVLKISGSNKLGGSAFETYYFYKTMDGDLYQYDSDHSMVSKLKEHMVDKEIETIDRDKIMKNLK